MAKAAAQALADRDITHVVSSPLERAQQTAEPIAAQFGLDDRHRRAADREQQLLRGQAGRRRRRRAARPAQLVGAARPVRAVLGRELPARSRSGCSPRCTPPGPRPRATRRSASRTSCRSGRCAGTWSASGSGTTRAGGSAGWPASPPSTSTAPTLVGIGYTEPAAHLVALSPGAGRPRAPDALRARGSAGSAVGRSAVGRRGWPWPAACVAAAGAPAGRPAPTHRRRARCAAADRAAAPALHRRAARRRRVRPGRPPGQGRGGQLLGLLVRARAGPRPTTWSRRTRRPRPRASTFVGINIRDDRDEAKAFVRGQVDLPEHVRPGRQGGARVRRRRRTPSRPR